MNRKIVVNLTLSLLLIISALILIIQNQVNKPLNLTKAEFITISNGTSISAISRDLVKKGWLESSFWFRGYVKLKPKLTAVKVGTYLIEPGSSSVQLLKKIVEGKEYHFSITFIEGSTFKEWIATLLQHPNLKHTLEKSSIEGIASQLKINISNPEGLFFPDTYAFTQGTEDIKILERAYKKMQSELNKLWKSRGTGLPFETPYQALIMASILEKESSKANELPMIASVFINRLNNNMRLQTDPTVIYGLGDRYKGNITRKHLREITAYNTYRINGLPPTPIAMPGLVALNATMNPIDSDYLYFVSNGKGEHVFSTNFTDHNKAVAEYLMVTRKLNE